MYIIFNVHLKLQSRNATHILWPEYGHTSKLTGESDLLLMEYLVINLTVWKKNTNLNDVPHPRSHIVRGTLALKQTGGKNSG